MYYIMQKSEENESIFYLEKICYQIKSFVHVYIYMYVNAIFYNYLHYTYYTNWEMKHKNRPLLLCNFNKPFCKVSSGFH